jgi:microcystin-dependent protein
MGPITRCFQENQAFLPGPGGTWAFNPASSQIPPAPLVMAKGKQLVVDNNLELAGIDNQKIDFSGLPQGNLKLGSAALAAASSFQLAGAATGLSSTASDTLTVGTGPTTFHTATGLAYATNMVVTAYYASNVAMFMQGAVTSYNTNTGVLVVNITNTGGSGSYSLWTISISGPQGATGATGPAGTPIGSGLEWYSTSLPSGWLWQDGSAISRATYAGLFAVIGTTWGIGDGSTTFNLPDSRGRVAIGSGQGATAEGGGGGTNRVLGVKAGAETHTQSAAEMYAHQHYPYLSDPGHVHSITATGGGYSAGDVQTGNVNCYPIQYPSTNLAYTGISVAEYNQGSSSPMTIMNPFYVATKIIRYQ